MAANPSEKCKLCQCNFKTKFGSSAERPGRDGYKSSKNLFALTSSYVRLIFFRSAATPAKIAISSKCPK